jgi:hypothetical protein
VIRLNILKIQRPIDLTTEIVSDVDQAFDGKRPTKY